MSTFPKNFVFGGATAAYQAEGAVNVGGKGKTMWDDYLAEHGTYSAEVASDFYHKYKEDLKLSSEYGINGIRISITWSRIFPDGYVTVPNASGVQFYHDLIDECLRNGIEPYVTLHHFDTPKALFDLGDWLSQTMVDEYVKFGEFCFKEFGNKVKYWITINEPWSVVAGQYIIGHFPPNIKYDVVKAVQSMHNMLVGHARLVNAYKAGGYIGEIGIVHILESKYALEDNDDSHRAALLENILANQFLLDGSFRGRYEKETLSVITDILEANGGELVIRTGEMDTLEKAAQKIDFLGMNYYASHFLVGYKGESQIHHNGTGEKGSSVFAIKGVGARVNNPKVPTTDWDWPIYPKGMFDMLVYIKQRYPNYNKIYITENGMGDKDIFVDGKIQDKARIDYVKKHLQAILEAREAGVEVSGYFIWSLMDLFSWTNGYNKRYGLFYVDFETQERFVKESAHWFKRVAASLRLEEK